MTHKVPNIGLRVTTNVAPLQIEGTIEGHPFYFRARGKEWEMSIWPRDAQPDADGTYFDTPTDYYHSEQYGTGRADASWMDVEVAKRLVSQCAEDFHD